MMFLVLIETSGNQNYIFSTNKLKENIGASELTYRSGTKWVLEAVKLVDNTAPWDKWENNEELRNILLEPKINKPITPKNDVKVEVIIAASGKALLLTKEKEDAKKIIRYVSKKALEKAPGLDICGVIEPFDWEKQKLGDINRIVHKKFILVRSRRPSPDLRFLRLPVVDECATSGLPVSRWEPDSNGEPVALSSVSYSKREYEEQWFNRIEVLIKRKKTNVDFRRSVRALYEELTAKENSQPLEWLAVIHADGNGLGEIFLKFDSHIKNEKLNCAEANRDYVDKLRKFSLALDICTESAFISALDAFTPTDKGLLTIVPLVLGGDDLTVVCDGKAALEFTKLFLTAFEKETGSSAHLDGIIPEIANIALKAPRLSACAGVAIAKFKFPFSTAYGLAEELMQSAKQVKKRVVDVEKGQPYPCSALDFHVLYDSSNVDLKRIRDKLVQDKTVLHNRPYVVTANTDIENAKGLDWAEFHQWSTLREKVEVLLAKDDEDRRKLPNSQMHELRAGLFLGKDVADYRYKLIRDRYRKNEILKLAGSEESLFQKEPESENETTALRLFRT